MGKSKYLPTAIGIAILWLSLGCSPVGGPSLELLPGLPSETAFAEGVNAPTGADRSTEVSENQTAEPVPASLGFIDEAGNAVVLENGGRVPLGEDRVAEIFLSPFRGRRRPQSFERILASTAPTPALQSLTQG